MPQPHIQPRATHAYGWWWVLALIIIGAAIYWGVSGGHGNRNNAVAGVPGTGTLPIAAIQANPGQYYGKTASGTATVYQVVSPNGFWLEVNNNRLFCLAGDQTTVDLPAAVPANDTVVGGNGITANGNNTGSNNQVTNNVGAYGGNGPTRNLYPDEEVNVTGIIDNPSQQTSTTTNNLTDQDRDAMKDQKAFLSLTTLTAASAATTTTGITSTNTTAPVTTTTPATTTTSTTTPATTATPTTTTTTTPNGVSATTAVPPVATRTTTRTTVRSTTNNGAPAATATGSSTTTPNSTMNNGAASNHGTSMNNGTSANNGTSMNNGTSANNGAGMNTTTPANAAKNSGSSY